MIQSGIAAIKAGKKRDARRIFSEVVRQQPENTAAWWYLSAVVDDPEQKVQCLRQVIRLEPAHAEARQLLGKLQPTIATVTPPRGSIRPVLDAAEESDGKAVIRASPQPAVLEQPDEAEEPDGRGSELTVMIAATVIALIAIIATVVAVVTGFAQESLGIRPIGVEPTLIPVGFGVPACLLSNDETTKLVFINNTDLTLDVLRGSEGQETTLLTLAPGAQDVVDTRPDFPVRYAVRTDAPGYGGGGAILEVPAASTCRIPIQ